jgi:TolB-like protein
LPDSAKALVIVLLCIGFIIAVFLSWVYDITPAGVKKTKPVSELKHVDHTTHAASGGWKIATYISAAIILALIAFNFISRRNLNADISKLDKSIAVLPFKSLSDDPNNQYLADGMMDAILLHLSKIKDLRVLPRTSVEQYRGTTKVAHDIGQELDVEYLLEGSFQKFGDNARLIVQLIRARKESHVWANEYNSKWSEVFSVQSGVAQTIAKELYASITPAEKGLIEKVPTSNMTAYNLYLKANDYQKEYQKTRDLSSYYTAVNLYKSALEIDSAYAKAYTGLAGAY